MNLRRPSPRLLAYPLHWHELRGNGSFFTRAGPKLSFVIDGFDVSIPSTNEVSPSRQTQEDRRSTSRNSSEAYLDGCLCFCCYLSGEEYASQ